MRGEQIRNNDELASFYKTSLISITETELYLAGSEAQNSGKRWRTLKMEVANPESMLPINPESV
jgi:hypothetical protein